MPPLLASKMTALTELVIPEEPVFQLPKPSKWRQSVWLVREFLGTPVKKSRDEYYAEQFSRALEVYDARLREYKGVVDGLKGTYEALTASLRDDEEKIRALDARLRQPYSLDMRLLYHNTDSDEPQNRMFENTSALEALLDELRTGLDTLVVIDPQTFEAEYGATPEMYRKAGEQVMELVEREILDRQEAGIDIEQLTEKLITLRNRRQTIFESYKNARGLYVSFQNLVGLLEIDAKARALIIQAAAQSEHLELGSGMILHLYERLASAEAHARVVLATPLEDASLRQLQLGYEAGDNTVRQLVDNEKQK